MVRKGNATTKGNGQAANLGFESTLWLAADKLRNNVDAAEYKHVVLGLIFLKYISDAFQEKYNELVIEKQQGADPEDPDEYGAYNIFWVPKEARWTSLQANAKQPTIGKQIDDAMVAIERDNPTLKGVLPKDFARPSLDKQRLGELIDLISSINLGDRDNRFKDILGRVYEYFLSQFASAEGKKGGQFYTPKCVVQLLVAMLAPYKGRVYDPCCGSGGMFVQSERFIEEHGGKIGDISIYGQESNPTTWRLAKMNLAIRGIDANLGQEHADSFHRDLHPDLKADYILANPPFNSSDWGGERLREDKRWKFGVPPVSNANYAWVQHFIHHLSPSGIAGFVLAQVSLFSESAIENEIRKGIVESDLVDCIVTLPVKLFYSTPTPVCLWFIARDKRNGQFRDRRGQVLFIDASGFGSLGTRTHSYLTDEDISRISTLYCLWRKKAGNYKDVPGICRSVSIEEIRNSGYSLFPAKHIRIDLSGIGIGQEHSAGLISERISSYNEAHKCLYDAILAVDKALLVILTDGTIQPPRMYNTLRLRDVLERTDERLGDCHEPEILTCTERSGLILQRERFAKRVAAEDTTKYKVVHKTDIVYNPYLLWAGAIDQCWIVDIGITSPAYEVLKIRQGFDPTLVGTLIKSPRLLKMYDGISVGTVQRRRRAPVERFLDLEVVIPSVDDQARFMDLAAAIQQEIASLRYVSKTVAEILQDCCRFWLRTDEE